MGVSFGMGMGPDMGMGNGMMMEKENFLMSFIHSLPMWAQGLLLAVTVIALAWAAGIIIGKLYASVKYPDPEKPALINPLLKIGLGAAIIACGFWIYSSFTKPDEPVITDIENSMEDIMPEDEIPQGELPDNAIMQDSPMDIAPAAEAAAVAG